MEKKKNFDPLSFFLDFPFFGVNKSFFYVFFFLQSTAAAAAHAADAAVLLLASSNFAVLPPRAYRWYLSTSARRLSYLSAQKSRCSSAAVAENFSRSCSSTLE